MIAKENKMEKKTRPIIRIWDLGNGDYQVDVDTLRITKNQAYNIMSVLAKIHKKSILDEVRKNDNTNG